MFLILLTACPKTPGFESPQTPGSTKERVKEPAIQPEETKPEAEEAEKQEEAKPKPQESAELKNLTHFVPGNEAAISSEELELALLLNAHRAMDAHLDMTQKSEALTRAKLVVSEICKRFGSWWSGSCSVIFDRLKGFKNPEALEKTKEEILKAEDAEYYSITLRPFNSDDAQRALDRLSH